MTSRSSSSEPNDGDDCSGGGSAARCSNGDDTHTGDALRLASEGGGEAGGDERISSEEVELEAERARRTIGLSLLELDDADDDADAASLVVGRGGGGGRKRGFLRLRPTALSAILKVAVAVAVEVEVAMVADATRGVRVSTGALVDGWMDGWRAGQRRSAEAGPLPLPQCLSLEARKDRLVDGQRVVRSLVRAADGTHSHARTHSHSRSRAPQGREQRGRERERARERAAQAQRPIQTTAEILALSAILAALCYLRVIIPQRNATHRNLLPSTLLTALAIEQNGILSCQCSRRLVFPSGVGGSVLCCALRTNHDNDVDSSLLLDGTQGLAYE